MLLSASRTGNCFTAALPLRAIASTSRTVFLICIISLFLLTKDLLFFSRSSAPTAQKTLAWNARMAQYFLDFPAPIASFAEMGQRVKLLAEWMEADLASASASHDSVNDLGLSEYSMLLEDLTGAMFPFLDNRPDVDDAHYTPLRNLRKTFVPGSKGIVIPTGKKNFRFACHLISNLRGPLKSKLPIQVVYAGALDLPVGHQKAIRGLGENIELLDITAALDDDSLDLQQAGWAIKPFALLASTFEQVILMDADAIFLQKPEVIFEAHRGYRETGTLLFHDRLIDRWSFGPRHDFYARQMAHLVPSATFQQSVVMREGYSQEADSGVVVMDKRRLNVLFALLFACWQNSRVVRENVTYKVTHGDKETYWLGLELSETPYTFAKQYGAALGYINETSVCGSTITHVDEKGRLLWFNGSLLKRKEYLRDLRAFVDAKDMVWMMGGVWRWCTTSTSTGCMEGGQAWKLSAGEKEIMRGSVEGAKKMDEVYEQLMLWPKEPVIIKNEEEEEDESQRTMELFEKFMLEDEERRARDARERMLKDESVSGGSEQKSGDTTMQLTGRPGGGELLAPLSEAMRKSSVIHEGRFNISKADAANETTAAKVNATAAITRNDTAKRA